MNMEKVYYSKNETGWLSIIAVNKKSNMAIGVIANTSITSKLRWGQLVKVDMLPKIPRVICKVKEIPNTGSWQVVL